jgi:hypothetical protein
MYILTAREEEGTEDTDGKLGLKVDNNDDSIFDFCGIGLILWCRFTASVHLFMCFGVAMLWLLQTFAKINPTRLVTPLTRTIGLWVNDDMDVKSPDIQLGNSIQLSAGCGLINPWNATQASYRVVPLILSFGDLDTRILVLIFYAMSGFFQFVGSFDGVEYYRPLREGHNHISHFVEYSISASVLVLGISAQLGVTDFFTLVGIVSNTWSCMIFGLLAELLNQDRVDGDEAVGGTVTILWFRLPHYVIAHLAGWVCMISALASAGSNLINYETCISKKNGDTFWIIGQVAAYFELVLFISFGAVQSVSLMGKPYKPLARDPDCDDIMYERVWWSSVIEFTFMMLSLTAKVGLGVMVYAANLI